MSTQVSPNNDLPTVRKLTDGYMLQRKDGSIRFLEWWEAVAWVLFKKMPKDSV